MTVEFKKRIQAPRAEPPERSGAAPAPLARRIAELEAAVVQQQRHIQSLHLGFWFLAFFVFGLPTVFALVVWL